MCAGMYMLSVKQKYFLTLISAHYKRKLITSACFPLMIQKFMNIISNQLIQPHITQLIYFTILYHFFE